jgi:hypothetical protein
MELNFNDKVLVLLADFKNAWLVIAAKLKN